MKIIYIIKNSFEEERIRNNLIDLAEQDSIIFFNSYYSAHDFINNSIVKNQNSLDLIIIKNNVYFQKGHDFYSELIKDKERTYSNHDFNLSEIPTAFIVGKQENKGAFENYGFNLVLDNLGSDRIHLFVSEFRSVVKSWRRSVLDELDNLGIKLNSGKIDFAYYLSDKRKRNISTKILSNNFKQLPRRLNYGWIIANEKQIEVAIDKYIRELKRSERYPDKREEKRFQQLFDRYPFLLQRDNYQKQWSQPKFPINESESFRPDFGLQPNFSHKTELSILDLKLPNEGFIQKTKFHPSFYSRIIKHIDQINDYKDYLESEEYYKDIKEI